MARNRVLHAVLLTTGVLLVAGCASVTGPSPAQRYFEREARNYQKYEHEGQIVYCTHRNGGASLIPYTGEVRCISETQLRQAVDNFRRTRNAVTPAVAPGTGQGGIG